MAFIDTLEGVNTGSFAVAGQLLLWVNRYRAFPARPAQKSALARKPT